MKRAGHRYSLLAVHTIVALALAVALAAPASAAAGRPNCADGARSTCLHRQIAWEAAFALSGSRADGTSSRVVYGWYESDWRAPSYPSSDQNALNQIANRLPRSYWGDYSSDYHGGQCFFFAHDITFRASRGYVQLPASTAQLYNEGTSDRTKWREGDVLQFTANSSHTAVLWRVNARDASGRATSVDVIDSNWDNGSGRERIHRHTLTVNSGSGMGNLGYSWRAFGYGKYN